MTRKEAMKAASWWRRARLTRMSHYRCTCGVWHIGNNRSKPKQR